MLAWQEDYFKYKAYFHTTVIISHYNKLYLLGLKLNQPSDTKLIMAWGINSEKTRDGGCVWNSGFLQICGKDPGMEFGALDNREGMKTCHIRKERW